MRGERCAEKNQTDGYNPKLDYAFRRFPFSRLFSAW